MVYAIPIKADALWMARSLYFGTRTCPSILLLGVIFYITEIGCKAALCHQVALTEIQLENYDMLKYKHSLKIYFSLWLRSKQFPLS